MTKEELLDLLDVERYAPRPGDGCADTHPRWDDSEVATARRRRELEDALEGFETPREGPAYGPRIKKEAS